MLLTFCCLFLGTAGGTLSCLSLSASSSPKFGKLHFILVFFFFPALIQIPFADICLITLWNLPNMHLMNRGREGAGGHVQPQPKKWTKSMKLSLSENLALLCPDLTLQIFRLWLHTVCCQISRQSDWNAVQVSSFCPLNKWRSQLKRQTQWSPRPLVFFYCQRNLIQVIPEVVKSPSLHYFWAFQSALLHRHKCHFCI